MRRYSIAVGSPNSLARLLQEAEVIGPVNVVDDTKAVTDWTSTAGVRCRTIGAIVWRPDTSSWEYRLRNEATLQDFASGLDQALWIIEPLVGDPSPARRLKRPKWFRGSDESGRFISYRIARVLDDEEILAAAGVKSVDVPDTIETLISVPSVAEEPGYATLQDEGAN